ncbi:hypothetical protein N7508_007196 [Penicillium antarcticum]|uniref:uncharacterized protein n=1 Tax=Penicillium antarcticum TaxID=416450 RepID=UPI0023A62416|nr:uncharacterized protein N7508_007196 [Penicillium antarcticum]KAJ5302333.1 hypothetical protein N7508_007196 [Penicillium antarcticum]
MPSERLRTKRERLCSWCSKTFSKDEHLARHVRTHTREKPFICPICRKPFSRQYVLSLVSTEGGQKNTEHCLSDSLLRHMRCHPSSVLQEGVEARAAMDNTNDAPQKSHNHQVSSYGQSPDYRELPTPPHQSSAVGSEYPGGINTRSTSYSFANQATATSDFQEVAPKNKEKNTPGFPTPGSQSRLTTLDSSFADLTQHGSWMFEDSNIQIPAWFADDDFDLSALNSEIIMSTTKWLPGHLSNSQNEPTVPIIQPQEEDNTPPREELIRTHWHTYMGPTWLGLSRTGHITPEMIPEQTQVDEAYRASLAVKLQPDIPFLPLPSTDFLNLCIQMYFTKFHPVFPIVHAPTFRPSSKSSLLLLSICSIGSLFVGSSYAASQGMKIFETLNKAILSSWEGYFSRQGLETIAMIQAALIGQTFGLLSGRQKDLLIAQTFHGTLVVWAKRVTGSQMMKKASEYVSLSDITHTPERAWKTWIQAEERNRLLAGIHIHDVEISELFISDPYFRHSPSKLPLLSDDEPWLAKTAKEWSQKMITHLSGSHSYASSLRPSTRIPDELSFSKNTMTNGFHTYLELESLAASAMEAKSTANLEQQSSYENALINLYETKISPSGAQNAETYSLAVLWHSAFISLHADINRIELAIGKEGLTESENQREYIREWASSPDGQRCALHAAIILRELQKSPIGTEPPIHIPRIIFRAAVIWFCYTEFGAEMTNNCHPSVEFPELQKIGINCQRLTFEANGFKVLRPTISESSTFCGLVDVLPRVGHWGVSRLFTSILNLLVPDFKDDERYLRL